MGVRFVIRSAEGKTLAEEIAYGFEQSRIVIGRGAGADVRIPHLTVSETHATVRLDGDAYSILDNDSTNGTLVNGARLVPGRGKRLRTGDQIEIGVYALVFQSGIALPQATTVERTAELARRLFRQAQTGMRLGDPRLCILTGPGTGKSLDIPRPPARLLVGSAASCQLVIVDSAVSAEHAEVRRDLDGASISMLDARADIDVNGQRVRERRLRDGDEIIFGTTRVLYEEPAEEPIDGLSAEVDVKLSALLRPFSDAARTVDATPVVDPDPPLAEGAPDKALSESAPALARARRRRRAGWDADFLIYALAAIVIALSAAGLIVLMRN